MSGLIGVVATMRFDDGIASKYLLDHKQVVTWRATKSKRSGPVNCKVGRIGELHQGARHYLGPATLSMLVQHVGQSGFESVEEWRRHYAYLNGQSQDFAAAARQYETGSLFLVDIRPDARRVFVP